MLSVKRSGNQYRLYRYSPENRKQGEVWFATVPAATTPDNVPQAVIDLLSDSELRSLRARLSENKHFDSLDRLAVRVAANDFGRYGAMSKGEKIYVALAASRADLLEDLGDTLAQAIARLGEDWMSELVERWRYRPSPAWIAKDEADRACQEAPDSDDPGPAPRGRAP